MKHIIHVAVAVIGLASCGEVEAPPANANASLKAVVVTAAGTVRNATVTLDVQLGDVLSPRPVAADATTLAPNSAIQP